MSDGVNEKVIKELSAIYYLGRIVRHRGERKVIKSIDFCPYGRTIVTFVDNTKCDNLKDIELDGRR